MGDPARGGPGACKSSAPWCGLRRPGRDRPPTPGMTRRRCFPSSVAKFGICQMAGLCRRLLHCVCARARGAVRSEGGNAPSPHLGNTRPRAPGRRSPRPRAAPPQAAGGVPAAPAPRREEPGSELRTQRRGEIKRGCVCRRVQGAERAGSEGPGCDGDTWKALSLRATPVNLRPGVPGRGRGGRGSPR